MIRLESEGKEGWLVELVWLRGLTQVGREKCGDRGAGELVWLNGLLGWSRWVR